MNADAFIANWSTASVSERAQYQSFVSQLCRVLGVPAPDDDRPGDRDYGYERAVRFRHDDGNSHTGFIDCYRRGSFVLEAKQSDKRMGGGALDPEPQLRMMRRGRCAPTSPASVDRLMRHAKKQAEGYAKALDEWPPFLVIVDVGRSIELWSDFARQGKTYVPFPDRTHHRIGLNELADPEVRKWLAAVWTDPLSLDPARKAARVTTAISTPLAALIRSIGARAPRGADGRVDPIHQAAWDDKVATFMMQCLFAMFADSVGLIEERGFLRLMEAYRDRPHQFHHGAQIFFRTMDQGGHCPAIRRDLRRFNGGLFRKDAVVEITGPELEQLIQAGQRDWRSVEPAIFGSLLEQALEPGQRAELGAHYTPRPFVEALVEPTVMEPLRREWEGVEALAIADYQKGNVRAARAGVRRFHQSLCATRVLDPACGTGNFLYVAMDLMKALETEVLSVLAELGDDRQALDLDGVMVGPGQFLGLEKNRRAAAIAEMVRWIGHLQWQFRPHGRAQPSDPVLRNFGAIRTRDALIACDPDKPARDLQPGRHGRSAWPEADFIIGNPPFMGAKAQRRELGDVYVHTLRALSPGRFRSADLVMRWWDRAAEILVTPNSRLRRFGFITTNSVTQTFSRRVVEHHLNGPVPMRLAFAVPDHPWLRGPDAAAVRVAMTVVEKGRPTGRGRLRTVIAEPDAGPVYQEREGLIRSDLGIGADVTTAVALRANEGLASRGVQLMGTGFIVEAAKARQLLESSDAGTESPMRQYRNGRDLTDRPRAVEVIDLFGWDEAAVRRRHSGIYQHLLETVKPDRDRNARSGYRDAWWILGEPRRELRLALEGLERYIVTVETGKHRWFRFLDKQVLPDNRLVCVASDDPFVLGVLSSSVHLAWARATGGLLEDRPVYAKTACFERFAFPSPSVKAREDIAVLAKDLDRLRAEVLDRHGDLTMTGLYNARGLVGQAGTMSAAQRDVHQRGCVGLIDHLHTRLDAAVLAAYGWPQDIGEEAIVTRLAALNQAAAADEREGRVNWLRPAYQRGRTGSPEPLEVSTTLSLSEVGPPLPAADDAMATALLEMLRQAGRPMQPRSLARGFVVRSTNRAALRIERVLAVLAVAGSVQKTDDGWFAPRRIN
ncbi:hypothetical protein KOAAANKH_01708 [Brevundimonas sp. NIBR10]|uniref:class I SAM-dependent DNA methyltransferase n=1 Tax=Brevundimonas sp. NIBR10 TaxID=3015997 RepID=UPI0022F14BE0|nr:DNA methyltransferase [Brevundimonas sp. NIBR10]WGM46834.1 hypothetical protein KOAAANKH_01708 [Brevundimonas sp. NIBR10]